MLDILNPQVSTVAKGIEGKTFVFYGDNSVGKTKQATSADKPFYLAFERGINSIAGIPFAPILTWADFIQVRKQFTNPLTLDKVQEKYKTIIADTVDNMAMLCQDYICKKFGADSIATGSANPSVEKGKGRGLWSEYKAAFWQEISALTNCGYTVIFIAHKTETEVTAPDGSKHMKIVPAGDARSITPIVDLCDVVVYIHQNGLDENGKEIRSSAYMVNTPQFLARSRFDYMIPYLEEFSMENLTQALIEAIEKEEEVTGIKSVSFEEQNALYKKEDVAFDKIKEEIKEFALKLNDLGRMAEYTKIVEEALGASATVSTATETQIQQLEVILADLKNLDIAE